MASPARERSSSNSTVHAQDHDGSDTSKAEEANRDVEKGEVGGNAQAEKKDKPEKDPNLVEWDGPDDPGNPMNWSITKKWVTTLSLAMITFCITFASSVFSTATEVTAAEFGVSTEVTTLGTSLFVLGFAFGPLAWGPFSELYGRKIPLFIGFTVFAIFQIPVAVAVNLETIMLGRFFGGLFGCAPLAIVGGALADFWNPVDRGVAVCIFAGATFVGPVAGPIVGSFITESYLGWRWTAWITLIMSAAFGLQGVFLYDESYGPVILQNRAKKIRFETQNWALHSKLDETRTTPSDIVNKYLLKAFRMLFLEPILVLITIYMALIYGILYLFFTSYPVAFQEVRGWSPGLASLPFLGITIGVLFGGSIIAYLTKTRFARKLRENNGRVVPEERLPSMIIGAFLLPIGLFWFAWTSNPNVSWVPQVLAGIPTGAGVLMIFIQGLNYIIDVYLMHANSGIAANTFIRSLAGAGFPLFAGPMFANLGVPWATSLLGFLTVIMIPVPVLFFMYGHKIRSWSKFSPTAGK